MKKTLIVIVLIFSIIAALSPKLLGFSVFHLGHALEVASAMSAKLACSGRYVSGLDEATVFEDLSSYSPATKLVELDYSEPNTVKASLLGLSYSEAKYRKGLGCNLTLGNQSHFDNIYVPDIQPSDKPWPVGDWVNTKDAQAKTNIQSTIDNIVATDNQRGLKTRALVVVKDGKIIAETYGDNITPNTKLLGWSMAKSVTAMMLARMQQLDIIASNPASLFPEWQDKRSDLRLKQLLNMTSGLTFDETYAPGTDATHMLFTAYSASDVALTSPLKKAPDTFFSYSSGTANLLARYLHNQLGYSTQADVNFLFEHLFAPLNLSHSVFETDSSGVFMGSSYIYASGRDWAKLGLLMLNQGLFNNEQLLPVGWTEAASSPNNSANEKAYGYQFWLNRGDEQLRWKLLPEDAYAMMGNRKQSVMIIPSENVVLVRLGWTKGEYPMEQNYRTILNALGSKDN